MSCLLLPRRIIRALAGGGHIVNMALAQASRRNPDKPGARLKRLDVRGPDIAHGGAQPPCQLMQYHGYRSAIGDLSLDPFWHEFQLVRDVLLEVAVRRSRPHGAERTHAAI